MEFIGNEEHSKYKIVLLKRANGGRGAWCDHCNEVCSRDVWDGLIVEGKCLSHETFETDKFCVGNEKFFRKVK